MPDAAGSDTARQRIAIPTWQALPWAPAMLAIACVALFLTSPIDGDFWWYDAASHAMDGAFVRDLIVAMPVDPVHWAIDYYLRLPAVTILFYPPLFAVVEGLAFLVFGVTHAVAQATVITFVWLFAWGTYTLSRERLSVPASTGAALLAIAMPVMAFWSRQVMLELPAYAFAVWSAVFVLRYLRTAQPIALYCAIVAFCLMLYTKQTFAFLGPAFIMVLLMFRGRTLLASREVLIAVGIAVVLLIPFGAMTLEFGRFNASLATDQATDTGNRVSGWLYYATMLPGTAGWLPLLMAPVGIFMSLRPGWRRPDALTTLLLAWFAIGYVFFSCVALKDARYTLHLLLPLAVFAALAMECLLPSQWGGWLALAVGLGSFGFTLLTQDVPRIGGFRTAAEEVARIAPPNATILFVGHRSAAFIFDLRSSGGRPDLAVLRPEKLLVDFRQGRRFVVAAKDVSDADIRDMLSRYRVTDAVVQPGYWDDLAPMHRLHQVLGSDQFHLVNEIPAPGNVPHEETSLRVLKNRGNVAGTRAPLVMDMPLIGRKFSQ